MGMCDLAPITIVTSDKKTIQVANKVMKCSSLIMELIASADDNEPIELETIDFNTMIMVIKWATHHQNNQREFKDGDNLDWDYNFLKEMDQPAIVAMIDAVDFLRIEALLNLLYEHLSGNE